MVNRLFSSPQFISILASMKPGLVFVLTRNASQGKIRFEVHSSSVWAILVNLVLILPPLALLYYIRLFGVNVVFWDEWEVVPLIQKTTSGSLNIAGSLRSTQRV